MSRSSIFRAALAVASISIVASSASASVVIDFLPFDDPGGLGQQVHSSGAQSATTVFGFLSPGTPLGVTVTSLSNLLTNGSGHAVIDGSDIGFDDLSIFFTNGELFNAIEFNIAALGNGQDSTDGTVSYFLNGSNIAAGSFAFNAGTGQNKIRLYGNADEALSRITFDATRSRYASIRQIDFGGISRLVPTPQGTVPEPATWAYMLAGFGAVGYSLRRRRPNRRVQAV